ncbi:MAG: hypothetical protein ACFFEN_02125 [Candidatus Thorarchaeota archaeon]
MNFAIPRNNNSDLVLYIWKIIDLPSIPLNDLIFKISYELFLQTPDKAKEFIEKCLESNFLNKDDNGNLTLSSSLYKKITVWQKQRKDKILDKIKSAKKITQIASDFKQEGTSNFSVLLKSFVDRATLNRAAIISNSAFNIKVFDAAKGIIDSTVLGSQDEPYIIEVNSKTKLLKHNCHDFETRKSSNKQFCKHLAKLFLVLRETNNESAEFFLKDIAENIDDWEFIF